MIGLDTERNENRSCFERNTLAYFKDALIYRFKTHSMKKYKQMFNSNLKLVQ